MLWCNIFLENQVFLHIMRINACNNVDKLTTYTYLTYYKACVAATLISDNALS